MKRERIAFAILAAVCIGLIAIVSSHTRGGGAGSAQSRAAAGWAAARLYVQARGTPVVLIDRPLAEALGPPGVLALVFPWQRWELSELRPLLLRHLQAGGDIVFAYSGEQPHPAGEGRVAEALGLDQTTLRPRPPLGPFAWRAFAATEWELRPPGDADPARAIRVRAFAHGFKAPADATTLLADAEGRALAFAFPRLRGRVVALPAALLANAGVGSRAAADLLETLRVGLRGAWSFDEYHHGLTAAVTPASVASRRVFDLWLLHLAVVYLLALLALARPFGPVWSEPTVCSGSAATFLRGLGALHRRLGHEREAAALLVARARELDPRIAERDPEGTGLLSLAQALAGERAPRRSR
jgi:hypothetical protein